MEFGIETWTMLIMNKRKGDARKKLSLRNQESIKSLKEKESDKCLGIFKASPCIKQTDIKKVRKEYWGCPRGVMVKAMDCGIVVSEFVLQSRYFVHFLANTLRKVMPPPYPSSYGLNSTNTVLLGEEHWH